MKAQSKVKGWLTTAIFVALLSSVPFSFTINKGEIRISDRYAVQAKTSGGRSSGGSFRAPSRSSGSRSSSSSRSKSSSSNRSRSYSPPSHSTPSYSSSSSSSSYNTYSPSPGVFFSVIYLGVGGTILFALVYAFLKSLSKHPILLPPAAEKNNDIFTVSKLQVGLLATASEVQSQLSQLTQKVDLNTPEGLEELLQETILVLLRHNEYWTHGLGISKSVSVEKAESLFEQFSITERAKLSSETLSNVNGNIQQKTVISPNNESADYIVVTLILGTAHDHQLWNSIHTVEELTQALQKLASMEKDYLMKIELLWSPQTKEDSLTYEELLTEYTNMVQLI